MNKSPALATSRPKWYVLFSYTVYMCTVLCIDDVANYFLLYLFVLSVLRCFVFGVERNIKHLLKKELLSSRGDWGRHNLVYRLSCTATDLLMETWILNPSDMVTHSYNAYVPILFPKLFSLNIYLFKKLLAKSARMSLILNKWESGSGPCLRTSGSLTFG